MCFTRPFVLPYLLREKYRNIESTLQNLTTTCAISAYHHQSCEFKYSSWRGVLDTTLILCDKVCQ